MKDTRVRILKKGLGLLAREGLHGVTLGTLAQRSDVSKSGLFAHFGSKQDVQLSLLDETARVAEATFIKPAMEAPAGLPRLVATVTAWFGWSDRAGLNGGCPIAAGMFEMDDADTSDPVRLRLLALEAQGRQLMTALVQDAIKAKHLNQSVDPDQFVWELTGIYLAHHTSHRFRRDPLALQRALTAFHSLVERSSGKTNTKRRTSQSKFGRRARAPGGSRGPRSGSR